MRFPSLTRLLLTGGVLAALSRLPGILARRGSDTAEPHLAPSSSPLAATADTTSVVPGDGSKHRADRDAARQRAADDGFGGSIDADGTDRRPSLQEQSSN